MSRDTVREPEAEEQDAMAELEHLMKMDERFLPPSVFKEPCANCLESGCGRLTVRVDKGRGVFVVEQWCPKCVGLNCLRRGHIATPAEAAKMHIPEAPKSPWGST